MNAPLIVTLKIEEKAQLFFNDLREKYFPKHINYLQAHCTMFHNLPADEPAIKTALSLACKRLSAKVNVTGITHIGNGIVYSLKCVELELLHLHLQQQFAPWLHRQDSQKWKPHITVQNKVSAFKAINLYKELSADFKSFDIMATGISTWLYLNGPWQHVEDIDFAL